MIVKQSGTNFLADINQRYFDGGLTSDFLQILSKLETYNNPTYF